DVSASPVLRNAVVEARVSAHPLVLEWIRLLCKSESNRSELIRQHRRFKDAAPEIKDLLAQKNAILQETSDLYGRVRSKVERLLAERIDLLKTLQPEHEDLVKLDDELGTLVPLLHLTRPLGSGPDAGRLGVPTV